MADKPQTQEEGRYVEPREAVDPEHRDAGQVYVDEQREKAEQAEREREKAKR